MSFDSIFHGAPSSTGGQSVSGGTASLGIDVSTGQIYFRTPSSGIWTPIPGGSGTVTSDQVTNESAVAGGTVTAALNQLNSGGVQVSHVLLSSTQLKNLLTSPPVLVSAQGAGTVIVLLNALGFFHTGSQTFSVSSQNAVISYGPSTINAVTNTFGADGTSAVDQMSLGLATPNGFNLVGTANLINQPLTLADSVDAGPNGNGTMDVWCYYVVVAA